MKILVDGIEYPCWNDYVEKHGKDPLNFKFLPATLGEIISLIANYHKSLSAKNIIPTLKFDHFFHDWYFANLDVWDDILAKKKAVREERVTEIDGKNLVLKLSGVKFIRAWIGNKTKNIYYIEKLDDPE